MGTILMTDLNKEYFINSVCRAKGWNIGLDGKPYAYTLCPEFYDSRFDTPEKLWEGFVKQYVIDLSIEFAQYLNKTKLDESAKQFFKNL